MKRNKILIVFAHPLYEKSRINKIINTYIPSTDEITFHDLYELYPEFEIDIQLERQLILEHDIIVWQFPLYWYSCPALMKQWMDMVLHFKNKDDLDINSMSQKAILPIISVGEMQKTFLDNTPDETSIFDYLLPFKRIVEFSNMKYYPPLLIKISKLSSMEDIYKKGEQYRYVLEGLVSNFISHRELNQFKSLNDWITYKQTFNG